MLLPEGRLLDEKRAVARRRAEERREYGDNETAPEIISGAVSTWEDGGCDSTLLRASRRDEIRQGLRAHSGSERRAYSIGGLIDSAARAHGAVGEA